MKAFIGKSTWLEEEGHRLDASTYASGGFEARENIQHGVHWKRLDQLARIFYGARFARNYIRDPERGVPFLSSSDMLLADIQGVPFLSLENTPPILMKNLVIRAGWTLISRSGTIGRTVFVRGEMEGMTASEDIIRVVPENPTVRPGYLFAFLTSVHAQAMIKQKTYGNVIQHIEPQHIADLPVPLPDEAKQQYIHNLVVNAGQARTEASMLLRDAAGYFDALAKPMLRTHDHALAIGITFRSRLNYRLDAFHHVGWAAEAPLRGDPLGEIAAISIPGRSMLVAAENGIPFFTGIDIYQLRPRSTKKVARYLSGVSEWKITSGTVLIQVDGQRYGLVGRPAYVGKRLQDVAASWHMARITGDQFSRIFAFAHSDVGRRAILRQSFGTSVPSISAHLLAEVEVPPLPSHLVAKVNKALALREQADEYEELAIREVEQWVN